MENYLSNCGHHLIILRSLYGNCISSLCYRCNKIVICNKVDNYSNNATIIEIFNFKCENYYKIFYFWIQKHTINLLLLYLTYNELFVTFSKKCVIKHKLCFFHKKNYGLPNIKSNNNKCCFIL